MSPFSVLKPADDGAAQRVAARLLGNCREAKNVAFGIGAREALHAAERGLSRGERAGFVECGAIDFGEALKRIAFAHEHAPLGGAADCRHDGCRRCKYQGAWTEDDENRNGADFFSGGEPRDEGHGERGGHDPGGPAVGKPHDFRPARVRGFDKLCHAGDRGGFAHGICPKFKNPEAVDGPRHHVVARGFVYRDRFTRQDGFVNGSAAREDLAVHRDGFTGIDSDGFAFLHL